MSQHWMNKSDLRVIKTARTFEAINDAAKAGLFPLIKEVIPSEEIKQKVSIIQNKKTGEIRELGDFRSGGAGEDWERIFDFKWYYPYSWEKPYAAYLIPPNLEVGERVFLEDVIEDLVGHSWNQGDCWRLDCCEAVWDGKEFKLDYDPHRRPEIQG